MNKKDSYRDFMGAKDTVGNTFMYFVPIAVGIVCYYVINTLLKSIESNLLWIGFPITGSIIIIGEIIISRVAHKHNK
jgi:hypothetical protein